MTGRNNPLYRHSLALLTDLYQLTMAYGYWKLGKADQQSVFHLFFRRAPFGGGYAIAAGLETVLDFLRDFHFDDGDLEYLASLTGNDGQRLFEAEFLDYLGAMKFSCNIDAVAEGTLVFAHQPLLRVTGPILQCQLLETALLNILNFQTLIATKASRICSAAQGEPILEFGLRRAQGIDGGLAASRAAHIGGCDATSNVLAGKLYDIPVKGTHAHSWVMSFDDEMDAFEGYAEVMPNNCVFLVDTYDTVEGVKKAIAVGKQLQSRGYEMVGVRLDSGDLAMLSIEARRLLDDAGFPDATIVASNGLDEEIITSLKQQGATINVWGVGTNLSTAKGQPALGGVYKLGAMQADDGTWQPKIKLSEQPIKTSIPGILQVRRFEDEAGMIADMIYNQQETLTAVDQMTTAVGQNRMRKIPAGLKSYDLLESVVEAGKVVSAEQPISQLRQRTIEQLQRLPAATKRFLNPTPYPVGLEPRLARLRTSMMQDN